MSDRALLEESGPAPQEVLEKGLSDYFGRPVRIVAMAGRSLVGGWIEYQIQRLRVTLGSGERLSVIFKRLLPHEDPVGKTYMREVLIYRRLLAGGRFGAPALYASVHDEERQRYWLFVEDLGDRTLDEGDVEDWLSAARWLAVLHGAYAGREDELRSVGCLGEHGPRFYNTLAAAARRNLALAGAVDGLGRFEDLMTGYASIVDELVSAPRTFVHGDFGSHNIALQPGRCIRPVDWEWAAIGPGAWDLARLLYGWGSQKPTFLDVYVAQLSRDGAITVEREELVRTVRLCEFVYRVWFLGEQPDVSWDRARVNELLDGMQARR